MFKKAKPKPLGGAPRTGKWIRQPEERRLGGRHRGSLVGLLFVAGAAVLILGGFLLWTNWQLDRGLLRQARQARQRPDWVQVEQLPPYLVDAFVAVVDTTSFPRRPLHGWSERTAVSRDLVRQVHLLEGGGLRDQAREMAMAPLLEFRRGGGAGLLELYLNRIYLGRTETWPLYGVYHASMEYFGKDPRRLTLGEAATLAGILLPPRLRDPEAVPGAVGARRNEVLRLLLASGKIDAAAFARAEAEPLGFQPGEDYDPMSRPLDWRGPPPVIRLPEALRPRPDSLASPPR